ncbi:D-alanyl-D-alanine carboxypeptidase family protein [Subtercola sp. YIM 133946]|uniref:D-alanyl-D-alanine carboxypeptidase family protein n=1 Tax=Subtercola sp. YIM 133946 TaxID=3118909 RepID=UPI002F946259
MATTVARRIRRGIFIGVGALIILAVGVYGPLTLVGPLPAATATVLGADSTLAATAPPTLPQTGASGITADDSSQVLATAGITDAVPLGGATKVITALVVLDAKPVAAGEQGASIVVTPADYAAYISYISESARAVSFITGETWSERDMLQAMLMGSSNNHADALATWAFGSMDAYLEAAQAWLMKNGFTSTTVVDATGLSSNSVGTAADLTRIAQLAFKTPVIAEIMGQTAATVNGGRYVNNLASYLPTEGVTGLSLSYTDQAGLCFLYKADMTVGSTTVTLYGAMLREPDYDTLHADMQTLLASATANLVPTTVVSEGDAFVRYDTAWGQSAEGVAIAGDSRMLWAATPVTHTVAASPVTTAPGSTPVGTVTFDLPAGALSVGLKLSNSLSDPGPLWRLANPVPVIRAFLDSQQSPAASSAPAPSGRTGAPATPEPTPASSPAAG